MGRIAELFEKKANGTITDAELKELDQLAKEASTLPKEGEDADTGKTDNDEETEAQVDKLAQHLVDKFTAGTAAVVDKMESISKSLSAFSTDKANDSVVQTGDARKSAVLFDPKLGQKTVGELAEIKVALPERKMQGKHVTEVTMKTVHFVKALMFKDVQKLQLLSEGVAADGGYLVPEEFANMIVEDVRDINIMRQIAAPAMRIAGDTLHLPSLASRPKAAFRGEKAVKNTSTAQFGENVFTPHSLAVIVGLSNELAADASLGVNGSIVTYVANLMATSIAEREEQAFWVGSGSGQPSGVDGGVYSLRTVAAAAATDTARADVISSIFHRTPQGHRNRASWVANSGTWEEIGRLKDAQGRFLLTDLANSPTQTLKGRPVYESNYLAGGTILFGDWAYYQIVDREGVSVRVSDEATVAGNSAFERNLTYVRVETRVDAELTLPGAVTKGTGLGTP